MLHLTLRQLQVFESAATHLNFSVTAKQLFLSQPAVSMQIKQLEENIGLPLFEQIGKKVFLTEAGRATPPGTALNLRLPGSPLTKIVLALTRNRNESCGWR